MMIIKWKIGSYILFLYNVHQQSLKYNKMLLYRQLRQ